MSTQSKLVDAVCCESCGMTTYMDCAHCYCVLQYEGQEHNCSDVDKKPEIVRPILCSICEEAVTNIN
jgi:hypothetical protein